MSVHDIPPAIDHPSSCDCFVCYCLGRKGARSAARTQRLMRENTPLRAGSRGGARIFRWF
jgi:hypothetical protein